MKRMPLISLALILSTTAIAGADAKQDVADDMARYLLRLPAIRSRPSLSPELPVAGCEKIVARARELEIAEADTWAGICGEFARSAIAAELIVALDDTQDWLGLIAIDPTKFSAGNVPRLGESADKCTAAVERANARGLPADMEIKIGMRNLAIKVGDARAKVCDPLAALVKKHGKDPEALTRTKRAEIAAPYKAVGIKGERLELLVEHVDYAMYGVGGRELTTPKQLKAAKVIFEVLGDDASIWTVRRFALAGDKIISTTEKEYFLKPGAAAFR